LHLEQDKNILLLSYFFFIHAVNGRVQVGKAASRKIEHDWFLLIEQYVYVLFSFCYLKVIFVLVYTEYYQIKIIYI